MEEKADKGKIFDTVLLTLKETRSAFFVNFLSGFALMLTAFGLILGYEKIKPIIAYFPRIWIRTFSQFSRLKMFSIQPTACLE